MKMQAPSPTKIYIYMSLLNREKAQNYSFKKPCLRNKIIKKKSLFHFNILTF